jgi:hypothetical protein
MFPNAFSEVRTSRGDVAHWRMLGVIVGAFCLPATQARSQSAPTISSASEDTLALLSPAPLASSNPLLKPSRDYRGVAWGDWMLYPSLFAGAGYDGNLIYSSTKPLSATGFRLVPTIAAVREIQNNKTTVYGDLDTRIYPNLPQANTLSGEVGASNIWTIERDLEVKAGAQYDHKAMDIGTGALTMPSRGPVTLASPLIYDQLGGSFAIKKSFNKTFIGIAFNTTKTVYDPLLTSGGWIPQSYRDNWVNSVTARGGAWFSPALYVFTEASGNMRDYNSSSLASRGYRIIAGLGSDRISLFRGEIFGGYQQQIYDQRQLGVASAFVFGGKIFWYPSRALTIRATLDQTFTDSSLPTPTNPNGYPQQLTTAELNATYQLAKDWSVMWRGGYDYAIYLGSARRDHGWLSGASLKYQLYRNVDLTVDFDFAKVVSNYEFGGFTRNAVNAGAKWRY